jgi:hypothetical protein
MIIKAWCEIPGRAANIARVFRPQARFIIVGHTHYPGAWKVASRVIINTGSFVPYFGARAVILESGRLELRRVDRFNRKFVLGRRLESFAIECLRPTEGV